MLQTFLNLFPPPVEVRDFFDLTPFYQQWINVGGFPVLASEEVNPYAIKEAAWVTWADDWASSGYSKGTRAR